MITPTPSIPAGSLGSACPLGITPSTPALSISHVLHDPPAPPGTLTKLYRYLFSSANPASAVPIPLEVLFRFSLVALLSIFNQPPPPIQSVLLLSPLTVMILTSFSTLFAAPMVFSLTLILVVSMTSLINLLLSPSIVWLFCIPSIVLHLFHVLYKPPTTPTTLSAQQLTTHSHSFQTHQS